MSDPAPSDSGEPAGSAPGVAIALVDVAKEFTGGGEEVQAVRQVDLEIGGGEFFSLLGPSGCGKTTTLRMIAGFEEPSRGQILLYGRDMVGVPPYRRDVNMVFQSYALFPHMSVFENIAFGLRRKKQPDAYVGLQVDQIVSIVRLEGMESRRPTELSGGQQQRVALARALINKPRALLLDEPLAALDLKLRQNMQIELKRIQREVGISFVFVTHDQGEALTLSDRLAVMNDGLVEQVGTPHDIYERPATRFVAGFIGTSNIVEGTVTDVVGGVGVVRLTDDERLLVANSSVRTGDRLEMTVRPEKIELHAQSDPPAVDGTRVRGVVTEVVYLGTSTTYTVRMTGDTEVIVFRQNVVSTSEARQGEPVWLTWRPEHSYVIKDSLPADPAAQPAPVP